MPDTQTTLDDRAALERVFSAPEPSADWFSPSFLAAVPLATIAAIFTQIKAQEGAFERIDRKGDAYYAVFQRAQNPVTLSRDAAGRFVGLRLLTPVLRTDSLEEALTYLPSTSGASSYLITDGRHETAAFDADRPLAVGSAFKLAVLAALRARIEAKKSAWDEVVSLPERMKSLPSGPLRDWPAGTPITLATYAAQMISVSDNTAADVLANVVGRSALEALSPRNTPFLTTRELFAIKTKRAGLSATYRNASLDARRALLATLDARAAPAVEDIDPSPASLDIEWYFSVRELCSLMQRVQDLELMTINPGSAARTDWQRIAYKGGSEPGVLNLTSYVTSQSGASYCVSATWNDANAPLDESALVSAYGAVLERLAHHPSKETT